MSTEVDASDEPVKVVSDKKAHKGAMPLIAHVIYRLDVGGLENGLVNIINGTPKGRYRHAIICLTEYTGFKERIRDGDVQFFALHKREGLDFGVYVKLWRLLRRLRPDIIHTRNLAAMEAMVPAALAGIRCRIHGEHGREMDLNGNSRRYKIWRRVFRPLVDRYIPLSQDLERWLLEDIGVPRRKIVQIYNGVDTQTFYPAEQGRGLLPVVSFAPTDKIVIGTIGRMQAIKDQITLVRAFLELLDMIPDGRDKLRLVLVGDGPLRQEAIELLERGGASELAWVPGVRDDIPELLRALDIFVLPSLSEGISNTILEAMATGLPVVATRVGGNPELVVEGDTGELVPRADPTALANALKGYVINRERISSHGRAGRERVERTFSIHSMVDQYLAMYDSLVQSRLARA